MSENFRKCTSDPTIKNKSELMFGYFVKLTRDEICLITQREVQYLLERNIPFYHEDAEGDHFIARFSDLSLKQSFITDN